MRLTQIVCPKCSTSLSSKAGIEVGTAVACPKCKEKFAASAPNKKAADDAVVDDDFDVVDEEVDEASAKKSAPRRHTVDDDDEKSPKKSTRQSNQRDDEDDEDSKPKKRRPAEDDNRPMAKKRARDDEDDDHSRPKKKRKRRKDEDDEELGVYGQLKKNIWVRVGVLGVLLTVFGIAAYLLFLKNNKTDDAPVTVVNNDEELSKPIPPNPYKKAANELTVADTQKFQGAWSATSATVDGQKYSGQGLRDFRFVINDGVIWHAQNNVKNASRSKIDAAKKPAEIDLFHNNQNNTTSPGIYRFVDKDTLEICSHLEPGERPKEFAAPKGSKNLHMILKRDTGSGEPKQIANDAERLKGTWTATTLNVRQQTDSHDGALSAFIKMGLQPEALQNIRLTINDDQLIVEGTEHSDHYTIDITKNPAEIDLTHPDGSKSLGICRFRDNDTLEMCFSHQGERPQNLPPVPGVTDSAYLVLKRNP